MPRQKTEVKTVYKLSELEGSGRERALEWVAEGATADSFWYECVIDDAKTIGALMGIEIKDVFFSGFSSQGDGAQFTGSYSYRKGSAKLVKDHAPQDVKLHRIVTDLQKIQSRNFYRLTAGVTSRGRGSASYNTEVSVSEPTVPGDDEALTEVLRDYMDWIYRMLEAEYEYRTSEAALLEDAEANEWEFTSDGRIA